MKTGSIIIVVIIIAISGICGIYGSYLIGWERGNDEGISEGFAMAFLSFGPVYMWEPEELGPFMEHVEAELIYVTSVEPVGLVNLSRMEFRYVVYNVTFLRLEIEQINQSIETWWQNNTEQTYWMTFNLAFANKLKPPEENELYKIYYLYMARHCYWVIHYEPVYAGRV